jgi:hypothetical protein
VRQIPWDDQDLASELLESAKNRAVALALGDSDAASGPRKKKRRPRKK